MNNLRSVFAFALIAALSACGGDGSSGDSAPSISNLIYSPTSELQLPGERATITGTVDFVDSGQNVVEMHLSTSAGDSLTIPLSLSGVGKGTLTGTFTVSLDQIGQTRVC